MSVQILGTLTQNERLGSFCVVNHPTSAFDLKLKL